MSVTFSLEGEDRIIASLLRAVPDDVGTYFDIGAHHPTLISNTYYFYQRGWSGLCVDLDKSHATAWAAQRPRDRFVAALLSGPNQYGREVAWTKFPDSTMNTVDVSTAKRYSQRFLGEHIESHKMIATTATSLWSSFSETAGRLVTEIIGRPRQPAAPTFVSIDTEGHELPIVHGFELQKLRPALFCIEIKGLNLLRPQDNELVAYMLDNDYRLVAKTPLDSFFVDRLSPYFGWMPREMLA